MSRTRDNLLTVLKYLHGFELEVPFTGLSGRRQFRFDAALPERKIALEYDGIGPGHSWPKEQAKDHEKRSEAAIAGWKVITCDAILVNNGRCLELVETVLRSE